MVDVIDVNGLAGLLASDSRLLWPAAVAAGIMGCFALLLFRSAFARLLRKMPKHLDERMTLIAALMATGFAGQGMWQVFGEVLHLEGPLRLLFAFLEVAVLASAFRARRNVDERDDGDAGTDGKAMWVLTSISAVLSALDSKSLIEVLARLAAPLIAAWLWERIMHGERERKQERSARRRINSRITLERALIWLGVAEPSERSASEVDAHRRLNRVALAAMRARSLPESARPARRVRARRAFDRALREAVGRAALGTSPERQRALWEMLRAMGSGEHLLTADLPPLWREAETSHDVPAVREEAIAPALPGALPADQQAPSVPRPRALPTSRGSAPAPKPRPESPKDRALAYFREQLARGVPIVPKDLEEHVESGESTARRWHSEFRQMPEFAERWAQLKAESARQSGDRAPAGSGEREGESAHRSEREAAGERSQSGERSASESAGHEPGPGEVASGNGHAPAGEMSRPLIAAAAGNGN
ncbi:hypothetical protein GCM10017673_37990 [Streptosporangium violaceochromogenes]|nr:hypothetical protein GCM10017673_37990 [Streptosporangium violaceochromogenes]